MLLCSNLIDQIWSFHLILYLQHLKVFCTLTFEMELKEYKVILNAFMFHIIMYVYYIVFSFPFNSCTTFDIHLHTHYN